jgi:hypothetical protein
VYTKVALATLREVASANLLGRGLILFAPNEGLRLFQNHRTGNLNGKNIVAAGHFVHYVEHDFFQKSPQRSGARSFF